MHLAPRTSALVAAAAAITLLGASAAHAVGRDGATPPAGPGAVAHLSARPLTVAVIGDVPYGTEQEQSVGALVDEINHDTHVRLVLHVGDIKSGSTTCTDERLGAALDMFEGFKDPVVFTPGDNEWTDCHRVNNGAYDPLERLDAVRRTFFAEPGSLLGRRPATVEHQAQLPENVRLVESRVALATLHVVGSDNGLLPWSGLGSSAPTAEQTAEVQARIAAAVAWVDETFDVAQGARLRGVVLAMQADTWQPLPTAGHQAVVDRIAARTATFPGEVLLLQGDSHRFVADDPLGLDNFTRVVVHGETLPYEYLRLRISPVRGELFTWERVQVAS